MSATGAGWLVAALLLVAVLLLRPVRARAPAGTGGVRLPPLRRRRPGPRSPARPEDELLAGARLAERAAALLRAGVAPATAWRHATGGAPASGTTTDGVDLGDAPPAVRAVWRLAERTGAPAADALDACAAGLRADADAHAALRVATAGARVSARTVAVLPLVGLALGAVLGAPPWQTLLATTPGRACAVVGTLLLLAGRSWTRRMVRSAAGGLG
ncbi:type II secretion system F family protein [Kineococcus rubinsiae]|uniref:type II secretion system F family protein n=1 Tax=Kineococcus rubinsiae TaxID=2609562 RepID=UPI001431C3EC|nr:hypothetical protein [Kineococcus rubinsiae]